jgi:uncharacterized membrane protein
MAPRESSPRLGQSTDRPLAERLARGLGWFSVGLGATQIIAPGKLASAIGVENDRAIRGTMRPLGMRELGSGIGILTQRRPAGFVWARFAGDVMDLALLGVAAKNKRASGGRLAAATAAVFGVTIADALTARRLGRVHEGPQEVSRSITIDRAPEELYRLFRDLENLPRFMQHIESITVLDEKRSHWVVSAPAGTNVEWDAEIVEDRPNERIAWRSAPGADVEMSGAVYFETAPGGRGTEVTVELRYEAPLGAAGVAIAKLFGKEPGQQAEGDLRRMKQIIETGEVMRSDASVHRGPHPARPTRKRILVEDASPGTLGGTP